MLALRLLWRDWRGGELGILAAALVVAVAIVTGITLFTDRLQQAIVAQSSHFLAADRVLRSPRPIDPAWLQQARGMGLQQAEVVQFSSMLYAEDSVDSPMQLASIKAVSEQYPLRGLLDVSAEPFGDVSQTFEGPGRGEVWLDSRLFPILDIQLGDTVFVGDSQLPVTRVIVNEPDRGSVFASFGPRVLMNRADLAATGIIQPGSRVQYRYLFAGAESQLMAFGDWLQPRLDPSHKWQQLKDSQPRVASSLERAEQFLLLAGAMGVGLAGIAIALAARRYSERHFDYVAVMKSVGATSPRVIGLYLTNLLCLGAVATLIGCGLAYVLQETAISLVQEYLRVTELPAVTMRPFLVGAVTAFACLFAFALPPLLSLRKVSPLRVLRRDLDDSAVSAWSSYSMGIIGIALLMLWYSGRWQLTLAVLAGTALTFVVVGIIAWYLLRGSSALGMQAGSVWRLALASIRRRAAHNAVQVVIFSLSIMLLLVLGLLRSSLIEDWKIQLPEGTPNHFLINVSASEVEAVQQLLAENQLQVEPVYPMVRGRLLTVNNEPIAERFADNNEDSNSLDREINLTWADDFPSDNTLLAGEWWPADSTAAQVSIEAGLANRLGARVGDTLRFTIGSEPLEVTISSIRGLEWESMKPNFFMMFPPKLLQQYPATYITSFHLPADKKRVLNQFLREFPTITVIEMDAVITQIRAIVDQVSLAVEMVLVLIVISGMLVLVAGVQSSLDVRFQESAVLRTLGARRRVVMGSLGLEFLTLGLVAGLIAAFSAELAVYILQTFALNMDYVLHPWVWLSGPVIGAVLISVVGYLACREVVERPPVEVLRAL